MWSGMVDLIETKILSHHTPLYLNVYGQDHQVSKSVHLPHPVPGAGSLVLLESDPAKLIRLKSCKIFFGALYQCKYVHDISS